MVVVNLYPFRETAIRPGVTLEEAVEQIDIGGPTLAPAAARTTGTSSLLSVRTATASTRKAAGRRGHFSDYRRELAWEAFAHTAAYDAAIAAFLRSAQESRGLTPRS